MHPRRLGAALAVAVLASACQQVPDVLELEDALAATAVVPHRLVHEDVTTQHVVRTVALVEDGFRDVVRVLVDGEPVVDRIRRDDDVALRVLAPRWATVEPETTELPDVLVGDAFAAGRYVLDVGNAPPEVATAAGTDPLRERIDLVAIVRDALGGASEVVEWSPEASRPGTPVAEDRFPSPVDGEVRYDLRRPPLPPVARVHGQPQLAGVENVRKMAVYVRDGVVSRVVEHVEVLASAAEDLERWLVAHLDARGDVLAIAAVEQARRLDAARRSAFLLGTLSELRGQAGLPPVLPRERTIEVLEAGADLPAVELPDDAIAGRLHGVTLELPS